jgi:heme/copper-type cytochrome/quinol oxidase subunit 2
MYYGQCSELCGKDHAFMPIAVRVVSDQQFADWLGQAKSKGWVTSERDPLPTGRTQSISMAAAAASASE